MDSSLAPTNGSPGQPLRVLMVEDSEPDSVLLARALQRGGYAPKCFRVDTAENMNAALERHSWDLILADHSMPHFSAPAALALVKERGFDIPFVIVSGFIDEDTALAAMRSGAHDYVMKDRLARLVPVVQRELREAEVRRARNEYEAELRRAREELEMRVERRTAALKAANLQLEHVIEERKRLENELLEIAENERRRIGFDLHDDLGQKLTGLALMAKGLERRLGSEGHLAAADAERIQGHIHSLIQHTHNLAHQFGALDAHGDDPATMLKGLAANVRKMFGISCELHLKEPIPALPADTSTQLYKITQEAASNAVKHGKAARITIGLSSNHDRLVLTVKNDGLPFVPPPGAKQRMGLRIMNYRASTIGASLDVQPGHKNGTIVTCSLPIRDGLALYGAGPRTQPVEPAKAA
jgi:signal transduction histidine kinase